MKKTLLLLITILLLFNPLKSLASHYMGGEITWQCTPQGNFKFIMKVYRECAGIDYGATVQLQSNAPGFASINMSRISITDMSPVCSCPGGPFLICSTHGGISNTGRVQEHIYTSDISYPLGVPLTGVPPATGWYFGYTDCCRNPCHNITGSSSLYWYLRAWMYPYNNTNVSTCFDNSPRFEERPSTVICTGYPYQYNHVASDPELDSLSYSWDTPLSNGIFNPIMAYVPGYSFNSPLPGPVHSPNNIAATVNPITGVISFTSYTNGAFVTVTKVTAFKCNIKVAEIFREMQVVLLSCGSNNPPNVTPPFPNSVGQYTLYNTSVYAGQLVNFSISATDFEYCPGSNPPTAQTLKLYAVGSQFGAPINPNPGGCFNPPCATLVPTPTFTVPLTGQFGLQTSFSWKTECNHLATNVGCGVVSNVYNFLFKTMDNFCPAPGIRYATVTIMVLAKPKLISPPIHCLEVHTNGDVTLSWPPVVDTLDSFHSYHIWTYNPTTMNYYVVDSISNINTTSYTHIGAGANQSIKEYFLTVRCGCNGDSMSVATDTASTIFLNVVNPGPTFGGLNLSWNPTHNPILSSSTGIYEIWREYPTGVWNLISTTNNTNYFDSISLCKDSINYRIEISDTLINDTSGIIMCKSISRIHGDSIYDLISPSNPNIYVVTIDNNNQNGVISWDVNQYDDVIGYIVYSYLGGVYIPIDTVWGRMDTVYTDITNNPCNVIIEYSVQAFDSCDNVSNFSIVHNTLLLSVKQTDCLEENVLNWNSYNNMSPSLGGYNIYYNVNSGPMIFLSNVGSTILTYTHTGLNMGDTYGYYIEAYDINQIKFSESCIVSNTISMPTQPEYLYIKTATVENNDYIKLLIHTDPTVYVSEYRVYRSNGGILWNQISTLPMSIFSEIQFNDYTAVFQKQSYYYMVVVIDSCGYISDTSNIAHTILLNINVQQKQVYNILNWNDYEGFDGNPTTYNVWRRVDGILDPFPIQSYPPFIGNHTDDVGMLPQSSGNFIYFIEAVEGAGNQYGILSKSTSNEVQSFMDPKLFVPSAFTPNGTITENTTFKPIGVFIPLDNYEFTIFNRLGQIIFKTNSINQGWNGRFNDILSPEGVYTYLIKFTSSSNKPFEQRGTFVLLR